MKPVVALVAVRRDALLTVQPRRELVLTEPLVRKQASAQAVLWERLTQAVLPMSKALEQGLAM